jgi:hypothetical protein
VLASRRGARLDALPGRGTLGKLLAQTLRTPLDGVTAVDLRRVTAVGLVARTERGRVWLLDVARRHPGLAPVAEPEVPRVRVVDVSESEGSSRDPQEVSVPVRVSGDLVSRTRLAVRAFDPVQGVLLRRTTVVLQPGESEASFTVPFERDDLDDFPASSSFDVAVFPLDGSVMTTDYAGRMTLVDDDPAPEVAIRPVDRVVEEGADLRWRVRLSDPVDYFSSFSWRVVRAPGDVRQLRSDDVPASWLRSAGVRPPDRPVPLWRLDLFGVAALEPGRSRAVVSIPTLADDRTEEREAVALEFRGEPLDVGEPLRTARVRDDG